MGPMQGNSEHLPTSHALQGGFSLPEKDYREQCTAAARVRFVCVSYAAFYQMH